MIESVHMVISNTNIEISKKKLQFQSGKLGVSLCAKVFVSHLNPWPVASARIIALRLASWPFGNISAFTGNFQLIVNNPSTQ